MLDRSTIIGFVSGFTLILMAIVLQGSLIVFASLSAFLIVAGGVLAATLVNYSYENIKYSFLTIGRMMGAKSVDLRTDMELMRMFAKKVRTKGLLVIDDEIGNIDNDFLQNGLQLAVDGYNKESLSNILDDEIQSQERQLSISVKVLDSMSEYSPAFGMIGTLIGMILMLQNIQDPESLGSGLAVALITTLYGTILANMVLGPLAGKLEYLSKLDLNRKEMFRVGILSMVEEENPRIMENKMLIYLAPKQRAEYKKFHEKLPYGTDREDRLFQKWPKYQSEEWEKLNEDLEVETG
ncbi:motility protein A [Fodinibius salsisoli]|uniref:MotA/TolQ/ExbB proton channel family protein n=1 Tax=Fodinibius salsisoli TaxID=2820877 RepID=A0ABT3PHH6_9BACT|nr:MotA/TolQ/ExbB proton channel family protein [Fodinibius salsisoli]MCW9705371.1 MotA/TolQ/ExbB proton channel family protein [Fodinibius salsisoli]